MEHSIRGQAARGAVVVCALALLFGAARPASAVNSFVLFDTGQVRPLALSPDGTRLFALNTPDNRLEIFSVGAGGLTKTGSVEVGMEPIALAARSNTEVWVVNHLSDSVSIVDVSGTPQVVRTLLVGDEPRDIVFAGPGGTRAFITSARRGQNVPATVPPLLTTAGTPRALVWVFDATNLGSTLEGVPLTIIQLFGDTPRGLAVKPTPTGDIVLAAVFHSGNQTTAVTEGAVCDETNFTNNVVPGPCNVSGVTMPGGMPLPKKNVGGVNRPETGLIVKFDNATSQWRDQLARNWNPAVKFTLPDIDVFKIDATANPPVQMGADSAQFAHVGTVLFNMVVNPNPPLNGKVYVSNTDAHNEVRFEGPGVVGGSTVRGHLHEARITVLDGANVLPRHLNKHINYSVVPSPAGTATASLATPVGLAISSNGATLYVAGFGSQKIGVYDTAKLEADTFQTQPADGVSYVPLAAGGPSGVALDEAHNRLYVLTRFDNSISVVNTTSLLEEPLLKRPLYNPEPASITTGRRFLYDAAFTSSNGEASCSSCHIAGDFDSLGWDLGNPDDSVLNNPNPIRLAGPNPNFHPMKGPMTTQSLRGMADHGPMHWRGDRTAGNDPGGNALDEDGAFKKFNVAFSGLLGRSGPLTIGEMQAFTDFILQETYPPNPIRNLNNVLTPTQQAGHDLYFGRTTDTLFNCNGCHILDPPNDHFGSDGFTTFENETQMFKIPHLRNAYQKVGMFGMPAVPFLTPGNNGSQGPQVRGFGFLHDGSVDTLFRFHGASVFSVNTTERQQLEQFVLAFDSNMAPIVGQQVTLTSTNSGVSAVTTRLDLLDQRAALSECDVIVKGLVAGQQRGSVRLAGGQFRSDRASEPLLSAAQLRALAATVGQDLTYTAVPFGSGDRMGVDRDEDGFFDRDELDAGSDPADPLSIPPGAPTPTPTATGIPAGTATATATPTATGIPAGTSSALVPAKKLLIKNKLPDAESQNKIFVFSKSAGITAPIPGSAGDPTCNGSPNGTVKATLSVLSTTSGQSHTTNLPCQNWKLLGSFTNPKGYKYRDPDLVDGTAKIVMWKDQNELKAILTGKGPTVLGYDLQAGIVQDPVAVRFSYLSHDICMRCNSFNGKNGSDGKKFLGKQCPAPLACTP